MKTSKKKKKSNKWVWIIIFLVLAALLAAAYFTGNGQPKGTEVKNELVEKRTIKETVTASGKIFPETEVKISSDVSGEVVALYVEEGDSVRVGQLLAKIDPDAYFSAVDRGEATLNSVKASLANSRANIESSIAQKEQIMVQLNNANSIHNRNVQLYKDGVISKAEFDKSQTTVYQFEANLKSASANIRSAEKNAEGAQYQVKSSEATLKELKTNLNRTSIKSPTSGIVSSLSVEQGERVVGTIQMTGTEMMRIANLSSMEVQVDVSENDILRVSLNDDVDIEVDAYLDKIFKGKVSEIANSASNISKGGMSLNTDQVTNFVVKVRIDAKSYSDIVNAQSKYPFRPGMSASVDIYTNEVLDAISIPIQAVTVREKDSWKKKKKKKSGFKFGKKDKEENEEKKIEEDDLEEVVFLMSGDTVKVINVVTGIQDDEYIVIKSGLNVDDKIVTGPYSAVSKKLEMGDKVRDKNDEE
ncbi:MAG: efflux RND transporter periplasmic adaptor subunit [Saprospiraceae bacterium]